ncbi:MAG: hypothetical protein MZW92_09445 [Comamonadaceae bacterium]|nr:hypothetical protein [Comamonadaceae bacterium]
MLLYLIEQHGMGAWDLTNLLYKQSGLLGVSRASATTCATLLASSDARTPSWRWIYFCYRIARELGSLAAALGGIGRAGVHRRHRRARGGGARAGLRPLGLAGYRIGYCGQCR